MVAKAPRRRLDTASGTALTTLPSPSRRQRQGRTSCTLADHGEPCEPEDLVYLQGLAVDIVRRKCSKALARWAPTVCDVGQVVSVMDRAKLKSSELATTTRNRSVFCYIHTPNHSHVFNDALSDLSRSRGFLRKKLRRP